MSLCVCVCVCVSSVLELHLYCRSCQHCCDAQVIWGGAAPPQPRPPTWAVLCSLFCVCVMMLVCDDAGAQAGGSPPPSPTPPTPTPHGQFLLCASCARRLMVDSAKVRPDMFCVVLCDDVVRKMCTRVIYSVSVRVCAREKR